MFPPQFGQVAIGDQGQNLTLVIAPFLFDHGVSIQPGGHKALRARIFVIDLLQQAALAACLYIVSAQNLRQHLLLVRWGQVSQHFCQTVSAQFFRLLPAVPCLNGSLGVGSAGKADTGGVRFHGDAGVQQRLSQGLIVKPDGNEMPRQRSCLRHVDSSRFVGLRRMISNGFIVPQPEQVENHPQRKFPFGVLDAQKTDENFPCLFSPHSRPFCKFSCVFPCKLFLFPFFFPQSIGTFAYLFPFLSHPFLLY